MGANTDTWWQSLSSLGAGNLATIARIGLILTLAAIALVAIRRLVPKLREMVASRQDSKEGGQRVRTLSRVLRYSLSMLVIALTTVLVLGELGMSVGPILGAAGVVGIAVGFGAQTLVKDYFTGFFLLLENQIRQGDVVEAGGKAGVVEDLTLRYLRLRDYSGNVHFVPNSMISTVTNMTLGFAYAVMDVGVAYGTDLSHAMQIMRNTAQRLRADCMFQESILDDLEIAGVEKWADSAVIIRCRFRVAPLKQWDVRRANLLHLKEAFDREHIEIPFPHRKIITDARAGE